MKEIEHYVREELNLEGAIFKFYADSGAEPEEIAEVMGCSVAKVRNTLRGYPEVHFPKSPMRGIPPELAAKVKWLLGRFNIKETATICRLPIVTVWRLSNGDLHKKVMPWRPTIEAL